jgi:hypothetical protein
MYFYSGSRRRGSREDPHMATPLFYDIVPAIKYSEVVKSLSCCHPGERRGPEQPEEDGFRLPPE